MLVKVVMMDVMSPTGCLPEWSPKWSVGLVCQLRNHPGCAMQAWSTTDYSLDVFDRPWHSRPRPDGCLEGFMTRWRLTSLQAGARQTGRQREQVCTQVLGT